MKIAPSALAITVLMGWPLHAHAQDSAPTPPASVEATAPDVFLLHGKTIMNLRQIATPSPANTRFVGQEVALRDVCVARTAQLGFWVSAPGARRQVFVRPAEGSLITTQAGSTVSIQGVVRELTDDMRDALDDPSTAGDFIYLYGYIVRPAWPAPQASMASRTACAN
jgi:hypothetical protein